MCVCLVARRPPILIGIPYTRLCHFVNFQESNFDFVVNCSSKLKEEKENDEEKNVLLLGHENAFRRMSVFECELWIRKKGTKKL